MNKHSNKLNITDSKLFKDVSSVIGKVAALEELTKAYRGYTSPSDSYSFEWHMDINASFDWKRTPQGVRYWDSIYRKAKDLEEKQGHLV